MFAKRCSHLTITLLIATTTGGVGLDEPLRNLLPDTASGICTIVSNNCNKSCTCLLDGPNALHIGEGDPHEREFDSEGIKFDLSVGKTRPVVPLQDIASTNL